MAMFLSARVSAGFSEDLFKILINSLENVPVRMSRQNITLLMIEDIYLSPVNVSGKWFPIVYTSISKILMDIATTTGFKGTQSMPSLVRTEFTSKLKRSVYFFRRRL